ncbi:hypothetical protein AgCh_025495 [Apium graveolens]
MARITCFFVMVLTVVASMKVEARHEAFDCSGSLNQQATAKCSPFTRRGEKEPSGECCIAYRAFVESAKTKEERIQLCACIQRNARNNPANIANVDSLQRKCGIPFSFSSDPNFDCNTVN